MDGPVTVAVVAVGVYLYHKRHSLHSFLGGEVSAQTVHRDKHLRRKEIVEDTYNYKMQCS